MRIINQTTNCTQFAQGALSENITNLSGNLLKNAKNYIANHTPFTLRRLFSRFTPPPPPRFFNLIILGLISLTLTCSCPEEDGGSGNDELTCESPQFLNSDRTACVDNCPADEIKIDANDACVARAACTSPEVLNPNNNTCTALPCSAGELRDFTVNPPVCITETACRNAMGKFADSATGNCVTQATCTGTEGNVANVSGDCEGCTGSTFANTDRDRCINRAACVGTAGNIATSNSCNACSGATPLANTARNACIDSAACTSTAGNIATSNSCNACSGATPLANTARNACIDSAACTSTAGNIATSNSCNACSGATPLANTARNACIDLAACTSTAGNIATSNSCNACSGATPLANAARDTCISQNACQMLGSDFYGDPTTMVCDQCPSGQIRDTAGTGCSAPIYLWVTGCNVKGNMMDGTCSGTGTGLSRANSICENRRTTDASGASGTTTQAVLAATGQTNLSGTAGSFMIPNRGNRLVLRPDGNLIANSWTTFFTPGTNSMQSTRAGARVTYWTGIRVSSGAFVIGIGFAAYCSNWGSRNNAARGENGASNSTDNTRLASGRPDCSSNQRLLCVTY